MPTIKFQATKMKEAQVSHISLVERGANRIPFKIMKQENQGMSKKFAGLDLGNLGTLFARKADKAVEPTVVGVVAMKGEGFESIKKQVEEAGFSVADVIEHEDGSVIFKQEEFTAGEATTVIRMNDNVAIVTKGFSPYNMDVGTEGATFADLCTARGFYPGVAAIMDTLGESVRSACYSAKSPAEAKSAITKLFAEAQAYTAAFVSGLPQKAFKLETIAPEVPNGDGATSEAGAGEAESVEKGAKASKIKCKSCGTECAADCKECPNCGADPMAAPAKKDGEGEGQSAEGTTDGEGVEKGCAPKDTAMEGDKKKRKKSDGTSGEGDENAEDSLTEEKVSAIVATQVEALVTKAMGDVVSKLDGFATTFESINKSVSDMKGGLEAVQGRMDEAEKVAKSAKEAVTGTVVVGSETGDHAPTQKSESSGFGREIDTAFMPRVRKTHR